MNEATLNSINKYLSSIIFGLAFLSTSLVLVLVRLRLDKSMILLMIIFITGFFCRLPFFWREEQPSNLAFALATTVILTILYYFVFEMRRLKEMIISETQAALEARAKATRIVFIAFYLIFAIGNAGILLADYICTSYYPDVILSYATLFDTLILVRFVIRVGLDAFIIREFLLAYTVLLEKRVSLQRVTKVRIIVTLFLGVYVVMIYT